MKNILNTSPSNQALLAKRRLELIRRATVAEIHVMNLLDILDEDYCFQKGFFTATRFFIVDFYLKRRGKLCLELDGKIHENQVEYDKARDEFLTRERGFVMLRIPNELAMTLDALALQAMISCRPNERTDRA